MDDPKNTKPDYKEQKLEYEAKLLKVKFDQETKPGIGKVAKDWLPLILTLISILGAVYAFVIQSSDFLTQRENAYRFNIKSAMVELASDLDSKKRGRKEKGLEYFILL